MAIPLSTNRKNYIQVSIEFSEKMLEVKTKLLPEKRCVAITNFDCKIFDLKDV